MNKKILFVIPARSGSKGITNKNIQICAGETLLRRAVKHCLEVDHEKRIIVSTDEFNYLQHCYDLSNFDHFLRPKYLSGDSIGDVEVLVHALHSAETTFKELYSCVVMIQPTCPLRLRKYTEDTINAVIHDDFDSSFTAHKVDSKYHPLKSLLKNPNGTASHYLSDGANVISRQELNQTYIRNGACYAIKPKILCTKKLLINSNQTKIVETKKLISIDTSSELHYCEKILLGKKNEKLNDFYE